MKWDPVLFIFYSAAAAADAAVTVIDHFLKSIRLLNV